MFLSSWLKRFELDIKKLLGRRIQEIRKSKNIKQELLAEKIGIETASLSNIERGKYYPTSENLNKILEVLEISPDELFEFKHLDSTSELISEMNTAMENNRKLAMVMYKFYKSVFGMI